MSTLNPAHPSGIMRLHKLGHDYPITKGGRLSVEPCIRGPQGPRPEGRLHYVNLQPHPSHGPFAPKSTGPRLLFFDSLVALFQNFSNILFFFLFLFSSTFSFPPIPSFLYFLRLELILSYLILRSQGVYLQKLIFLPSHFSNLILHSYFVLNTREYISTLLYVFLLVYISFGTLHFP